MKLHYFLISSILLLSGCTGTPNLLPTFKKIKNPTFLIEDKKVEGKKVHVLSKREWKHVQEVVINSGTTANMCIDVIDNFNKR